MQPGQLHVKGSAPVGARVRCSPPCLRHRHPPARLLAAQPSHLSDCEITCSAHAL